MKFINLTKIEITVVKLFMVEVKCIFNILNQFKMYYEFLS